MSGRISIDLNDSNLVESLVRTRLAVDDRPLKRLIKRFYTLASHAPPSSRADRDDIEDWQEELQAHHSLFLSDLNAFKAGLEERVIGVARTARDECLRMGGTFGSVKYSGELGGEQAEIEQACESTMHEIKGLHVKLKEAQEIRAQKLAYNSVAHQISQYAPRATSVATIERLRNEVAELQREEGGYSDKWEKRRDAFDAAVKALVQLGDDIREEREGHERRLNFDEDDEIEDADLAPQEGGGAGQDENNTTDQERTEDEGGGGYHRQHHFLDPRASAFVPGGGSAPDRDGSSSRVGSPKDLHSPAEGAGNSSALQRNDPLSADHAGTYVSSKLSNHVTNNEEFEDGEEREEYEEGEMER